MRVLIATPAYGGMVHAQYLHGIIESIHGARQEGIELGVYTLKNESLVNRGRNACAAIALEQGFDKMVFIDSDIGWRWPELRMLIQSDKLVVGGTYPIKKFPIALNYNVLPNDLPVFNNGRKSIPDHEGLKQRADPKTGEIEVLHIPTGFMMIDVRALQKLAPTLPSYRDDVSVSGVLKRIVEFFPVRVQGEVLESEDWGFCRVCREHGIPVYLNTRVICSHTGTFTFQVPGGSGTDPNHGN